MCELLHCYSKRGGWYRCKSSFSVISGSLLLFSLPVGDFSILVNDGVHLCYQLICDIRVKHRLCSSVSIHYGKTSIGNWEWSRDRHSSSKCSFFISLPNVMNEMWTWVMSSVTRLGDLLHFGQLFSAFGNN